MSFCFKKNAEDIRKIIKFEIISNISFYEMYSIKESKELVARSFQKINIFNKKLQEIANLMILKCHCAVSNNNEIYVTINRSIYKYSSILQEIKRVHFDDLAYKDLSGGRPTSLSCINDSLYVCDNANSSILEFDLDLNYKKKLISFDPHSPPLFLRCAEKVFCVGMEKKIYFYDYGLVLKHEYSILNNIIQISCMASNFFITSSKRIICFDEEGKLIENIKMQEKLSHFIKDNFDGSFAYFDNKIICSSISENCLLKF